MISVLMPVYNAERYLAEAVHSILGQTWSALELIAVDDGSTDGSLEILRRIAATDPRLEVLSFPNRGIVMALNSGLAIARGDLVARMDADDVASPTRLAMQARYMERHRECIALGGQVLRTDPQGWPIARSRLPLGHNEIEARLFAGEGGALPHPTLMMRRADMIALGGYRVEAQWVEDIDLYLRAAEKGRLANLPDVLLRYRRHPQSVCALRRRQQEEVVDWIRRDVCDRRGLPEPTAAASHPSGGGAAATHFYWARTALSHAHPMTAAKQGVIGLCKLLQHRAPARSLAYTSEHAIPRPPRAAFPP